ncbi:MAG: hypothetical protein LRY73_09400 [Bacillus sp. (in: Bacteria)]|nr:hypothetical protein [Bacillus sp. (in: firmicutes)]
MIIYKYNDLRVNTIYIVFILRGGACHHPNFLVPQRLFHDEIKPMLQTEDHPVVELIYFSQTYFSNVNLMKPTVWLLRL